MAVFEKPFTETENPFVAGPSCDLGRGEAGEPRDQPHSTFLGRRPSPRLLVQSAPSHAGSLPTDNGEGVTTSRWSDRRRRQAAALLCTLVFASMLLQSSAARTPQRIEDLFRAGTAAFRAGRFADASAALQRVVAAEPQNGPAHAALVRALLRQGRVAAAAASAERGIALVAASGPLLAASGDVSVRQGALSRAGQLYSYAAAADVSCARAHLGLANLDLLERRNRSAKEHLERAHALDPDDPEILLGWASTLASTRERIAAAERYLAIGTNEDPDRLAAVRALRTTWMVLGEKPTNVVGAPDRRYAIGLREVITPEGPAHAYWLPVDINGRRLRLKLDTGAPGIVLKPGSARQARVQRLADGWPVGGIGGAGTRRGFTGFAEQVKIGELDVRNVVVRVLEPGDAALPDCDGLVGADVFDHFLVRLGFRDRLLELAPLEAGQTSIARDFWHVQRKARPGFTPVHVLGHLLLADASIDGRPGFLVAIDSGAFATVLSMSAAGKTSALGRPSVLVAGVFGQARDTLYTTRRLSLAFAGLSQSARFLTLDFDDQNSRAGTEIAGLVGLETLEAANTTIDYTNGLVQIVKR